MTDSKYTLDMKGVIWCGKDRIARVFVSARSTAQDNRNLGLCMQLISDANKGARHETEESHD